jgi:hypothetical protein
VLVSVDSLGITKQYFWHYVLVSENWCLRVLIAWGITKRYFLAVHIIADNWCLRVLMAWVITFLQCILVATIGAFGSY